MEFTNLKFAYFKDGYPLPRFDAFVDLVVGYSIMNFLCLLGYNQIKIHNTSWEKRTFITREVIYC